MISKNFRYERVWTVCGLIEVIRMTQLFDYDEMYLPLVLAIKQYVSDEDEQNKLIEVLTMDMPVDEVYEKVMSSGIYEKGFKQGLENEFAMALRIMESFGIDEAVRISRFSREDLERGELIK